jgi:hypothetical protein
MENINFRGQARSAVVWAGYGEVRLGKLRCGKLRGYRHCGNTVLVTS